MLTGRSIAGDVSVLEPSFAVLDVNVTFSNAHSTLASRFNFGAEQHHSRFERFVDEIVVASTSIR